MVLAEMAAAMVASASKHPLMKFITAVAIAKAPAWSRMKKSPSEHLKFVENAGPTMLAASAKLPILLWLSRSLAIGCEWKLKPPVSIAKRFAAA